ncbi:DegT/DnrJ/EryC1/StrS family aminotransferase [Natronosalvus halobius]|uniref:DegT/DnrJ/EryC1/StrS family aminotransferase n=1 Tax=Natronosalvus halobius TaxID=2953746 RepID=UPI00209DF78E|nr:DegT/DnrJ/EryC1/StrS family aminotransferase [Natronosalvus halobius]USZ72427.1 DegT/DnrJ/EryC1/StrS family aminotransferase [Natronosalvus halobius]
MGELAIDGGPKAAEALSIPEWPQPTDACRAYLLEAFEGGNWCRGPWIERLEDEFAAYHDAEHAIAVSNGTVAIELALRAVGVEPGDEVIVPSYSFIASASVVPAVGAIPRFADTDPETFNIDPNSVREQITDDTVGIIGVHFAGYPMDMDELLPIVEEHDLFLIEDAAHAQGSEWRGQKVGTFGDFGTFSFQESKSLPSGEGGIVVTDNDVLAERARVMQNIGRSQGETGYRHYKLASNSRMSAFQAAVAIGQLEKLPEENDRREANEELLLAELEEIGGIHTKPRDDRITARGYCLENVRYDAEAFGGLSRDRFIAAVRAEGVPVYDGYEVPIYKQPAFFRDQVRRLLPPGTDVPDYWNLHLPGAERLCRENVAFSHPVLLADEEGIRTIPAAIRKVKAHADELRER